MRGPRYRFPEGVRSAARSMATRMVREENVAATPEELDGWIAERDEVREPLVEGGYGTAFTAGDLLPLLHVFVAQAGGRVPSLEEAPPPPGRRPWVLPLAIALAIGIAAVLLVLAL